jgi:hypothetical protein
MKPKFFILSVVSAVAVTAAVVVAKPNSKGLVVHEWGTFTSLQGGNGQLIPWNPLKTPELPKFVYDWHKTTLGLQPVSMYAAGANGWITKGGIVSLQRMETPVVYFYSDQNQTVDVTVKFPQGFITEWYPRVSQIGPSVVAKDRASDPSVIGTDSRQSLVRWSNLHLLKADRNTKAEPSLPTDSSGSHYFAARETDANYIYQEPTKDIPQAQYEKFLFYRGVANFSTSLRVTMNSEDSVTLANTGTEPLSDLLVLGIKDKAGNFVHVGQLLPGEKKRVPISTHDLASAALARNISRSMSHALVRAGLYPREADAMVNTWKDSWFAEDGLRVLYILPQAWTERTLPMTLNPAPTNLTRVMVGRAEVLRPGLEHSLVLALDDAKRGSTTANANLRAMLKDLGRFAQPALQRAFANSKVQPDASFQYATLLDEPPGAKW